MNLKDKHVNGSTLPEEYILPAIIELGVIKRIPVFVFSAGTAVQFMNKLIPLQTQIIDSLPETIDKQEIIKWSENVGFNVYFTKFTYE